MSKMIEISKELLSEVLENDIDFKDCDSFKVVEVVEPSILISYCYPYYDNYGTDGICDCSFKKAETYINIYELAHKCKEWALNKGYLIGLNARQGVTLIDINTNKVLRYISIDGLGQITRFELNLCEWIYKELKK